MKPGAARGRAATSGSDAAVSLANRCVPSPAAVGNVLSVRGLHRRQQSGLAIAAKARVVPGHCAIALLRHYCV